jgi:molybdopterin/thiamine biosynthesis adenylyltransferase
MDHTRHLGIYTIPTYFRVGIVGAGGLGAMVALIFSKMGVTQLTAWDDDIVSTVNIATQLHQVQHVGLAKVDGLQQTLEAFSDEIIFDAIPERVTEDTCLPPFNLFVSAVDRIDARQAVWRAVAKANIDFYCDMRMAAEEFQVFAVDMHDMQTVERYYAQLMSLNDEDVVDLPCTEKATFFCSSIAAGHMGAILRNIVKDQQDSMRLVHYIPTFQVYTFKI